VTLNLKLFAVSDTRQKLIGLVNIPIDWKTPGTELIINKEIVPFSKCIDSKAYIQVSVSLKDITVPEKKSIRMGLHQRHIPKPKAASEIVRKTMSRTIDDSNVENFQEVDDEGQRPHVVVGNAFSRDTPIKRGALANKI